MLDVNMEFRKGILFVRLIGILNKDTNKKLDDYLERIIKKDNIRYIVFNVEELLYIDIRGVNTLLKFTLPLNKIKGKSVICGLKNNLVRERVDNSSMFRYMYETSDELGAINLINM